LEVVFKVVLIVMSTGIIGILITYLEEVEFIVNLTGVNGILRNNLDDKPYPMSLITAISVGFCSM